MCRIGQNDRCKQTGCEFSKIFTAHCYGEKIKSIKIPSYQEYLNKKYGVIEKTRKTKVVVFKKAKVENIIIVNEVVNPLKTAIQEDWIKKIKIV